MSAVQVEEQVDMWLLDITAGLQVNASAAVATDGCSLAVDVEAGYARQALNPGVKWHKVAEFGDKPASCAVGEYCDYYIAGRTRAAARQYSESAFVCRIKSRWRLL